MFSRPNVYEFLVEGSALWEKRVYLKMEFRLTAHGEALVVTWAETHLPERYEPKLHIPARVEETDKNFFSTNTDLIDHSEHRNDESWWLLRDMILALAKDDVSGASAGRMAWTIFNKIEIKDNARNGWLKAVAPEWWRRLHFQHAATSSEPS